MWWVALFALSLVGQHAIPAPEGAPREFGGTLAARGRVLAVFCGWDLTEDGKKRSIPAFLYERAAEAWTGPAELEHALASPAVVWMVTLAVDRGRVVAGLPLDPPSPSPSSVVTSLRGRAGWTTESVVEEERTGSLFGTSLDLDGDTLVVGATFEMARDTDWGAVYVFVWREGAWCRELRIVPGRPGPRLGGEFGGALALALDGDRLLIGSPGIPMTIRAGPVTVLARSDGQWVPDGLLYPDRPVEEMRSFGHSVDLAGDLAVVGTPFESRGGPGKGVVFAYRRRDGVWGLEQVVRSESGPEGLVFADRVLLHEGLLLVAARNWGDGRRAGAVHAFRHDGESWVPAGEPIVGDPETQQGFANAFAAAGDDLFVGAPWVNSGRGAVFRYSLAERFPR